MLGRTVRVMGVLTALVYLSTAAFADQTNVPKEAFSIPAGSVLHMKLTTTLTSKTNKTGDPFRSGHPADRCGQQRGGPEIQPSPRTCRLRKTLETC